MADPMRPIHDMTVQRRGTFRGLSLVELLVAAAIGIIASLAIFQVFAVFEGQKRTTTSGGEAQTSGTLSLLTDRARPAPSGLWLQHARPRGLHPAGMGPAGRRRADSGPFVPALITQGAGSSTGVAGSPDTLTVAYGNEDALGAPLRHPGRQSVTSRRFHQDRQRALRVPAGRSRRHRRNQESRARWHR